MVDSIVFLGKIEGKIKIKKDEISEIRLLTSNKALSLPLAATNKERILDYLSENGQWKN